MLCVSRNVQIVLEHAAVEVMDEADMHVSAELLDEIPGSNIPDIKGKKSI